MAARRCGGCGATGWRWPSARCSSSSCAICLAAPLWADTSPSTGRVKNHLTDTVTVDGKQTDVVVARRRADRPDVAAEFFLGADGNGRDIAVRLLYGGAQLAAHRDLGAR